MKANGYVKIGERHKHRIVAEQKLDRALIPGEVVHHIDGNSLNNSLENIQVLASQAEHARLHHTGVKRERPTNCKYGHEFTLENTYTYPDGRRRCRECQRDYDNNWKKSRRRARGLRRPGAKPGVIRNRDYHGRFAKENGQ